MWFCTSFSLFSRHFYPFFCNILEENEIFKHKYVYCNEHSILYGVSIVSDDSSAPPPLGRHQADLSTPWSPQPSAPLCSTWRCWWWRSSALVWRTPDDDHVWILHFKCSIWNKFSVYIVQTCIGTSNGNGVWRVSGECLEGVWMCIEGVWGCTVGYKYL